MHSLFDSNRSTSPQIHQGLALSPEGIFFLAIVLVINETSLTLGFQHYAGLGPAIIAGIIRTTLNVLSAARSYRRCGMPQLAQTEAYQDLIALVQNCRAAL